MDRQAKLGIGHDRWTSYGDVTHVDAAAKHAEEKRWKNRNAKFGPVRLGEVESMTVVTRCSETPDCEFHHLVFFDNSPTQVIPLR